MSYRRCSCVAALVACWLGLAITPARAGGGKGLLTIRDHRVPAMNAQEEGYYFGIIEVKWKIGQFMGEPTVGNTIRWDSGDDFAKLVDIDIRARVVAGGQTRNVYVLFDYFIPNDKAGEWGHNRMAGSPNWDKLFQNEDGTWVSAATAKDLYKAGIGLVNPEVISIECRKEDLPAASGESVVASVGTETKLEQGLPKSNRRAYGGEEARRKHKWGQHNVLSHWLRHYHLGGQSRVEPAGSGAFFRTEEKAWRHGGRQCEAWRIILEERSAPILGEEPIESARIEVVHEWNDLGSRSGKTEYSERLSLGEKLVFEVSTKDTGANLKGHILIRHLDPPKAKEEPPNPFAQDRAMDPFAVAAAKAGQNPFAKQVRAEEEARRKAAEEARRKAAEEVRRKAAEAEAQRRAAEEAKQSRLKREFENELAKAGLKLGSGDVQVTLTWDTSTDVDLHVTDPDGDTLSYNRKSVRSGGRLDVDNTRGGGPENVFWPKGKSPKGTYCVKVVLFKGRRASFKVRVFRGDRVYFYQGRLSGSGDKETVTTFTVD